MAEGPRIYNLFPSLAGTVAQWKSELPRIARMRFDWVFVNPFQEPGFSGSLYAVKDHYRLNPKFRGRARAKDDDLLRGFVDAADGSGLGVMMDLEINHTAKDATLVETNPDWFAREPDGNLRSPHAVDPDDARKITVWGDLAEIDYGHRPARDRIVAYWQDVVRHYVRLGFRGFRCDAAYKVPAEVWAPIIRAAREQRNDVVFAAETLGCRLDEVEQLAPAGFNYLFNSAKWWDFEAPWLLEQYETFRHIAPSIAFPESHDTERLGAELAAQGITHDADVEAIYRQRYLFAAAFSTGVMIPMGYEYGWQRKLDVVRTTSADQEPRHFDLSDFIGEVNRVKQEIPALNEEGPQLRLDIDGAVGLLREASRGGDWTLTLVNPSAVAAEARGTALASLIDRAVEVTPDAPPTEDTGASVSLQPHGLRLFRGGRAGSGAALDRTDTAAIAPTRSSIVIGNVYPEVDGGRHPVKRVVGDTLEVWADIFREGHDKLSAALLYRRVDSPVWQETPMVLVEPGLDRWRGRAPLSENTRYAYTIEAWPDPFSTWRDGVEKKRAADQDISLDLGEGRELVAEAALRAGVDHRRWLERQLAAFDDADAAARAAMLLSDTVAEIMASCPDRTVAVRYDRDFELVVDRPRAGFAAWYEMFPRSQGTEPGRSATFADCERRLPEIAEMGFDVVYLPPIHPIGRTHRKGPNNTLAAADHHPGSPYAIGSAEGGHTAVHPELGTLDDFRRFVGAAERLGMEIALDFAVQCSPDHPWIKEHPEWFLFRPDGTIKYAENPPKKYQDIVNVDFHGRAADALWEALRDVVLFWVAQGVRTFRVDNPHTKPVPFWEWLIREVQRDHPDTVFLSEAFTRPRVLEMLAKAGFSQSYTYFTWRNFKHELMEYLTDLTRGPVKEYLRPNFFTNTPDILPPFLQTGGRPAFKIRLVLAATLSSVYGIYNGFELCENRAVPGTEEYLDSEKYDYKVWDWDRPGNIKDFIARVNGIRRDNPALHTLLNLRFHQADDENVLFYSKMTPAMDNIVLVAVNLDPFEAHETDIVLPFPDLGLADDATVEVEELLAGEKHLWRGARQRIRLDPETNPAAVFRMTPWAPVDYREPCF